MLPPLAMKLLASSLAATTILSSLKVEYSEAEIPAEVATSFASTLAAIAVTTGRQSESEATTSSMRRMANTSCGQNGLLS
ncbi:hypothetical protein D9M71_212360 [compost metagenome]